MISSSRRVLSVGARSTSRPPGSSMTLWAEMITRRPDESMNCRPATSSTSDVVPSVTASSMDGAEDRGGVGVELADEHEHDLVALRCDLDGQWFFEFRHGVGW